LENVRVFVLGPPQDESMLKRSAPTKSGREVYDFAGEANLSASLNTAFVRLAASSPDGRADDCPFDSSVRFDGTRVSGPLSLLKAATWEASGEEWRRADDDWTNAAETLALNLDNHTNNTCLVLAFEFIDTGEVFLFPADAQVGNWLSWQNLRWKVRDAQGANVEITASDLLSRAVFYKVGHHGSHNATLRKLGLELMTSDELTAFVPVSKVEAGKNRWWGMPFKPLLQRLSEKTGGRLLVADERAPAPESLVALQPAERSRFSASLDDVTDDPSYFELTYR
jgi:hypothetical protein